MIVSIAPVGAGKVAVTSFREAVDAATAVSDYCNQFVPPKNPANFQGYDTGWSAYQYTAKGYYWAYDFDSPGLVEVLLPETERFSAFAQVQVVSDPKTDPSGPTTPFSWEDMGLLSTNLNYWFSDVSQAQFRVWGQHKTHQEGVNVPQIRLSAGGVAYSDEVELPDTADQWVNFVIDTIGYVLPSGRVLFSVQTKLRNALSTIELRAVSITTLQER